MHRFVIFLRMRLNLISHLLWNKRWAQSSWDPTVWHTRRGRMWKINLGWKLGKWTSPNRRGLWSSMPSCFCRTTAPSCPQRLPSWHWDDSQSYTFIWIYLLVETCPSAVNFIYWQIFPVSKSKWARHWLVTNPATRFPLCRQMEVGMSSSSFEFILWEYW